MAKKENVSWCGCCFGGFPTFAVIILAIGVIWLLNDLNVFTVDIPWFPVILIIIAVSWILDSYRKRS